MKRKTLFIYIVKSDSFQKQLKEDDHGDYV